MKFIPIQDRLVVKLYDKETKTSSCPMRPRSGRVGLTIRCQLG
jgi:hypothetical protein